MLGMSNKSGVHICIFSIVAMILSMVGFCGLFCAGNVYAEAKQSTLTVSMTQGILTMTLTPSGDGTFGKSSSSTIGVRTDNFSGYSMKIVSPGSTSLMNHNNDEIQSISSAIDETTFSSSTAYNNKWGYVPSQYMNGNTVVSNTDYLPAPSAGGDLLAKTNAANSVDDTYTLAFGARVDHTLPPDTYQYTFVLQIVANPIVYNVTYDDNAMSGETISGMPIPNPQVLQIDGGTPAADSHATLSSAVPTMSAQTVRTFGGWCTTDPTFNSTTGNDECSGTTYQAGDEYPIDQTVDGANITLYAIWITDPFPMVWSQMGKCVFTSTQTGSNSDTYQGNVSGSECSEYAGDEYIDTGIALYSNDNYQKDYEVHFTLDTFNPVSQLESQATMFNDKLSSSVTESPYGGKSPGAVVRLTSSHAFEIKSTYGAPTDHAVSKVVTKTPYTTAYNGTDVRIFRIDGHIYTSIDNGPLVELQDFTSFNQQFGLTAWFGAYPDNVDCTENCTAAKRFFTGEMSNMYIKLGDMPADRLHTITFDANGGTPATTEYLILDGDALSELPAVTQSGWFFDGWWTAQSGGQQISASTVPTATTTYYAHWYKSVTDAQITNTSISMSVSDTETINITNVTDIEPYTLVSSDSSVATVDSTGVITAVANGTTTITMTGTNTGDTRTISVTVGTTYTVNFDSQGGSPATYTELVGDGNSFSSLPEPTYTGFEFQGWYTGTNGSGTQLTTSTVFDSNTPTQYYAYWTQANYVCKAATVQHQETCSRSSGGCRGAGYAQNATIYYGSLIQSGATSLVAGNALDCDINNDGTFDAATERFYYYTTVGNNAALIYYKNTSNDENYYDDALDLLPDSSTTGWTNPNLVVYDSQLMGGDYEGKNTRFISYDETVAACDNSTNGFGTNGKCLYILEQSNFAYTNIRDGYWIGRDNHSTRVHTSSRYISDGSQRNGVRPVIEVPLSMIDLSVQIPTYQITFNPHNETASWTETIDAGDDLTDVYPATDPSYTDHIFQGWYTDPTTGTLVTSSTQPSGDATYHAHWLKTVQLATFASNSISVAAGSTETISVTNSAELENYEFSSLDNTVATVDPTTGVVTGVSAGTTSIRMTGASSLTFVDIPVTVTAPLSMVCQLAATGTLHTATRASDSASLTYGQIAVNTTPQSGDAYDCDVDYDGTFNASTERFYYLGQDGNNNAVLVAWNSYVNGSWAAGTGSDTIYTYSDGLAALPGNGAGEWDNPGLIEQATGKAARFTNYTEVVSACGNINVATAGALVACDYLMEHSAYDGSGRSALWLNYDGSTYRRIHSGNNNRHVTTADPTGNTSMVRPAIVVPYNLIEKFTPLDVTNAIISNNDLTVPVGGSITIVVSNSAMLEGYTFSSANDSIATVDSSTGVVTGVSAGTVNVIMTGTTSGLTKTLEVDVVVAPTISHTVTFEPNEGSFNDPSDASKSVVDNTALGAMPTPTRTNYMFFGWYKDDDTFYQEVYPEEIIDSDVTYYAKWVENTSSFPIEFSEINECNFTGTQVTGTYCSHTSASNYYIDTAKQLFTAANYYKDFEIGFNINEYVVANQIPGSDKASGMQATFVNSKAEDSTNNFPGFVLRRNTTKLQLTSRWKGDGSSAAVTINTVPHSIKISRKKEEATPGNVTYKLYYTVDGVENMYQNITNKTYFPFDTAVWFGGAVDADGVSSMRPLVGKLTDMYVKIGVQSDYVITFDANHGSLQSGEESRTITIGDPVGTLPVPTPPDSDFTFIGWFDESVTPNVQVTSTTIPTSNKTYVAHYQYQSSDEPVIFDVSNKATRDYNTLINTWQQSPINISTFNEASPINSSTWGDTSELSEANFWTGLKNNFQSNNCLVPTYKDTATTTPNPSNWSSGSVDCAKPSAYDTKIGAALNVYLNNSQGELVSYADASNGVIHNMIPGQTYYWERVDDSTVYGYVSAISDTNYHTRWVDTGIIRNTRDLGGLPVTYTDGNNQTVNGTLAYGRLFRGEKLWNAPATELTKLGINKEYDVGDPSEYSGNTKLPDYVNNQVIHYNFDYNTGDEDNNTSNYMRAWLAVTHIMQDITDANNPKNIYFHCRIGSDRTGTVAYLLEGLLGVPDEARYEEYELTHLSGQWDRTRYYKQKSNTNNLKFVFMMDYVKTNADIYNWYMKNPNADVSLIQSFRSAMVGSGTGNNSSSNSSSSPSSNSPSYSSLSNYQNTNDTDGESMDTDNSSVDNNSFTEPLGVNESVANTESGFDNGLAIAATAAIAGGGAIAYGAYKLNSDSKES